MQTKPVLHSSGFLQGANKQRHRPRAETSSDGKASHVPEAFRRYPSFGVVGDSLEKEQEVPILDWDSTHVRAGSAPQNTGVFSPLREHAAEEANATSPAALFLSTFTPQPSALVPPDTEGHDVAGYVLGSVIGHGGFSTIRKAQSSNGAVVAIKIVRQADVLLQEHSDEARQQLDNEAEVWSSLSHEHILPLFSVVRTPYAEFFITLFCPAGSLFDILKRDGRPALPQDDAGMMFRQVVRGLRYLHETAKLVHGDIKLENVLVDEMGMCRISDFGLSRTIGERRLVVEDEEKETKNKQPKQPKRHATPGLPVHLSLMRRTGPGRHRASSPFPSNTNKLPTHPIHFFQPGSLPYASPELLMPHSASSGMLGPSPAQDMWALGVLLFALLTGRLPFMDAFEPRLQMKILRGTYDEPPGIGHGAEQVLRGCIEKSVEHRWTIDMVDDIAWGIGWGSAGDASTPPEDIDRPTRRPMSRRSTSSASTSSQSTSRSRPRPYPANAARSQSRARPVRTPSTGASRSVSRDPVSAQTPRAPDFGHDHHTELVAERGRRVEKADHAPPHTPSPSRSPTVSVPPRTPPDTHRFDFDVGDVRTRGRTRSLRDGTHYGRVSTPGPDEILEKTSRWTCRSGPPERKTEYLGG